MKTPILSPFSEVVDKQRRWTPDWYSWLREFQDRADPASTTVAKLTPPGIAGPGATGFVIDSTQPYNGANTGANVVGGGANAVPVWTDGLTWKIG
jgi:hypothetical protein